MIFTVQLISEDDNGNTVMLHEFPHVFWLFDDAAEFSHKIRHNTRIASYKRDGYFEWKPDENSRMFKG